MDEHQVKIRLKALELLAVVPERAEGWRLGSLTGDWKPCWRRKGLERLRCRWLVSADSGWRMGETKPGPWMMEAGRLLVVGREVDPSEPWRTEPEPWGLASVKADRWRPWIPEPVSTTEGNDRSCKVLQLELRRAIDLKLDVQEAVKALMDFVPEVKLGAELT